MLNEWSDRMPSRDSREFWQQQAARSFHDRLAAIERVIGADIAGESAVQVGFYDAMRHFLTLREKLFPNLPADPAWKILVTLAQEPECNARTSVTGIAYGADVPLTTALRYIAALEIEGVIERVRCPKDKRRVMIQLTAAGRQRLDIIAERWATRCLIAAMVPAGLLLYLLPLFVRF